MQFLIALGGVLAAAFLLAPHRHKEVQEEETKEEAKLKDRYLKRRAYYTETGNQVQLDLDRALIAISSGALALSLTFLQFANLPVTDLSLLEFSWNFLAISLASSIFSMVLSHTHWEYEVFVEDKSEAKRSSPKDTYKTDFYEKVMFETPLKHIHSNFMMGFLNKVILITLAIGIYDLGTFGYKNIEEKNRQAQALPLGPLPFKWSGVSTKILKIR